MQKYKQLNINGKEKRKVTFNEAKKMMENSLELQPGIFFPPFSSYFFMLI